MTNIIHFRPRYTPKTNDFRFVPWWHEGTDYECAGYDFKGIELLTLNITKFSDGSAFWSLHNDISDAIVWEAHEDSLETAKQACDACARQTLEYLRSEFESEQAGNLK